jgi:hypothetical protein
MASAAQDGPSRSFGLEFGLGAGILVVLLVVIGIATVGSIGALGIPYSMLAFLPGLIAWVPLLLVARRITRERRVAARVLASTAAALLAIGIDLGVVVLVITPLGGGYWGLWIVFALVASIGFLAAAIVAALVVHLGAGVRPSRS